jgi:hypothetical protein
LKINKQLDYRQKQKMLYVDKINQNSLQNYGDSFLEEGLLPDALDFYQRANHQDGLKKIKDMAFESGDVMLFQQAAKVLNLEIKPMDWESIAQKAMSFKKYLFARHALEKANNEEGLNALKKIMQNEVDVESK